jgi:hypothetical protein
MKIQTSVIVLAMLSLTACSGMVAPTNEGTGPGGTPKDAKASTDGTETGGETTGGETTGGETTGGETTGGETEGGETGGEPVGTITEVTTDLTEFTGKSTYYQFTGSGFNQLLISTADASQNLFKKIKSYSDCKTPETTSTTAVDTKQVTISFNKAFVADATHLVDDNGFPKGDTNEIKDPAEMKGVTGSLYDSKNPTAGITVKTGTVNFTKRPTAAGGDYKVNVDLTFSDGKKYKATLEGKVTVDNSAVTYEPCTPSTDYREAIYE